MHQEAPVPSGGTEQHCFLLWQISTRLHLSASLKTVPIVLWAEGIVFGFFLWVMLCYFILCLVTLLPDQSDETSLRHPSRYCEEVCRSVQHTVTGTVRERFAEVCSTAAGEESIGHKLNSIPPSRGPHAASLQFLLPSVYLIVTRHYSPMSSSIFPFVSIESICWPPLWCQSAMALFPRWKYSTIIWHC